MFRFVVAQYVTGKWLGKKVQFVDMFLITFHYFYLWLSFQVNM